MDDCTPAAIEASEEQGQRDMIAQCRLPTQMRGVTADELRARGFYLEGVADDPLFFAATLPDGWEFRAGSHAMWSTIHDETGAERFGVFYKAAFYDRKAWLSRSDGALSP